MTTPFAELAKAPRPTDSARSAGVTVVVPIRNEAAFISHTLAQLLDQDLTGINLEILVVDGQSTDQTREIVARYVERDPRIRLLENPQRLSSAARNVAIGQATGEYIVIVDGHCEIPSRTYFIDLARTFAETGADCLGRPQPLDVTHASSLQRAIAMARSSRLGHHPESFIYADQPQFVPAKSVAVAYRREVFEKVGQFDVSFDAHEDGEFNYRCDQAGLRCYFAPSLAVKYFPRASLMGLFRQMMRYGRGRVRFSRKHPGTWSLGALMPAIFVAYVILGGVFAAFVKSLVAAYILGLATYLFTVTMAAILIAVPRRTPRLLGWLPLAIVAIHAGAGCGILIELIHRRSP